MTLDELRNAKFIALETFRKSGQGITTPVWQVPEGDNLYVWTAANSWKVKRTRNNKRVRLCESDWQGKPLSDWVDANAHVLDSPEDAEKQRQRMASKYGWQFWLFHFFTKLTRTDHVVLQISPA